MYKPPLLWCGRSPSCKKGEKGGVVKRLPALCITVRECAGLLLVKMQYKPKEKVEHVEMQNPGYRYMIRIIRVALNNAELVIWYFKG